MLPPPQVATPVATAENQYQQEVQATKTQVATPLQENFFRDDEMASQEMKNIESGVATSSEKAGNPSSVNVPAVATPSVATPSVATPSLVNQEVWAWRHIYGRWERAKVICENGWRSVEVRFSDSKVAKVPKKFTSPFKGPDSQPKTAPKGLL